LKLLVVEDDSQLRGALIQLLGRWGYAREGSGDPRGIDIGRHEGAQKGAELAGGAKQLLQGDGAARAQRQDERGQRRQQD
jgi:DNA-binding response OmpR family regulator